jgi:hypothetical protein
MEKLFSATGFVATDVATMIYPEVFYNGTNFQKGC